VFNLIGRWYDDKLCCAVLAKLVVDKVHDNSEKAVIAQELDLARAVSEAEVTTSNVLVVLVDKWSSED